MNTHQGAKLILKLIPAFFLIVLAGVVAVTVSGAQQSIDAAVLASADGSPKSWSSATAYFAATNISPQLESKVVQNEYVEYISSLENKNSSETYYLTGLASYLDERNGLSGFADLNESNFEYTYTVENINSWKTLEIGAPSNRQDAFKLSEKLVLSPSGSDRSMIYFRYRVLPSVATSILDGRLSYLLENQRGLASYISANTSVAYTDLGNLDSPTVIADLESDPDDPSYLAPLGASSSQPDTALITAATSSTNGERLSAFMGFFGNAALTMLGVMIAGLILAAAVKRFLRV